MDGTESEGDPERTGHPESGGGARGGVQTDTGPPQPRQPWRDALAWAAAGLFAGALVLCLFGLARHLGLFGAELVGEIPESALTYWILLALVAVAGLVLPHTSLTVLEDEQDQGDATDAPAAPDAQDAPAASSAPDTPSTSAAPEAQDATHSFPRAHTVLLSVSSGILVFLVVWLFPRYPLTPASGRAVSSETEVLLWACLVALFLGGLLSLAAQRPPRRPFLSLVPLPCFTAAALAVVVAATVLGSVTHPEVVHTVAADDPGDPPSVPGSVSARGWTWAPPPGVSISRVAAGPRGPILLLDDGFVALDGATGSELWTYRELHGTELETRLDEGAALLTRSTGNGAATGMLLDPATGEIISERPDLEGLQTYTPTVSLHEYLSDDGTEGIEARSREPGLTGPADPLWSFVPQEADLFCEFQPRARPTTGPDTGDGLVVVAYACVDPEEFEEKTLETLEPQPIRGDYHGILAHGGSVDSLVATVAVLDLSTGEEVWRRDDPVLHSQHRIDLKSGRRALATEGEVPALELWSDYELFLLDPRTGEPQGYPEEARDRRGRFGPAVDRVLRADTGGAVLLMRGDYHGSDSPREVLTTDPDGKVIARVTIDESELDQEHLNQAIVLEDTLLIPYTDSDTRVMSVYAAPLAAGDFGGEWLEVGSPLEFGFRQEHRLTAAPGAVVSYITGDITEVHGLVP
ncbi:hypothetical protein NE857_12470 [Nocardiopsis exhalans]|uniref:PQQ-binding-like beta-propeller repeat protein n=1 Tax=Nocardiopsis exhalans TaxID=163604 RepID=A0ABY5DG41_9ACTN|nr:hypothetical protein [Nocardiopsis exhalans]USY22344.1 hypothetical protein NE857_12470 [Nocardiopsis exhalans]